MVTTYRLFGFTLASAVPLAGLASGSGRPDLELTSSAAPPADCRGLAPAYVSPYRTARGEPAARLFRLGAGDVLHFPGTADFLVGAGRIVGHAPRGAGPGLGACFLGPVAAYWLERRGLPVLHASAVAIGRTAVGFLAASGGGKSSTAAALVRLGCPLVTDDLLAVERRDGRFLARPGQPEVRMWPDAAAHLLGGWEHLPRVQDGIEKRQVRVGPEGFGTLCDSALPLAGLYLLDRRAAAGGTAEVSDLPRGRAVIELVRHSFAPHLVESVGLQPGRLDLFAELVQRVPVRRLVLPDGMEQLPRALAALLRKLEASAL